ncbi:MAG: DUF4956 domain-containing protein [Phycisphaeraceae bacterium]|nr:MAG: DUF4956 domain-containing protein [Phycisphaeraceae bacterium]
MPEWLHSPFQGDPDLTVHVVAVRLGCALVLGMVVAGVFRFTHGRPDEQSRQMMATLVLLTVLIAMMTLVIGNNVARAFSLVGALAIVRFRTVVEDTRDVAFVIFAVAVGMALGAGFLMIPLMAIPVAGAAAYLFRPREADREARRPGPNGMGIPFRVTVRTGAGLVTDAVLRQVISRHDEALRMESIGTTRQGASVETTWVVRLPDEAAAGALLASLHALDGVQGVEVKRER